MVDVEGAGGGKDDTVAGAPDAMPMQTVNGRQKPDFHGASAERAARYIVDEAGLDEEEQKAFVEANVSAAQAALDKHAQQKPKMGTDIDDYQEKKAAWEAEGERLCVLLHR